MTTVSGPVVDTSGRGINGVLWARTRDVITRYSAWVDSYPDDDPTPLLERQRVLRIALTNLQRLEGDTP